MADGKQSLKKDLKLIKTVHKYHYCLHLSIQRLKGKISIRLGHL